MESRRDRPKQGIGGAGLFAARAFRASSAHALEGPMKPLAIVFALTATPAFAHLGHLGEAAGHGHWIAAGALGAAALAAWLAAKGRKAKPEAEPQDSEDAEGAEA